MNEDISPREWESLSAYLDGELNLEEEKQFERTLNQKPALRRSLEKLRQTRLLLRQMPQIRAPRNFIITPEQTGIKPTGSLFDFSFTLLRAVSVIATILLVVVFTGDLLNRSGGIPSAPNMGALQEQEAFMLEQTAPPMEMPVEAAEILDDAQIEANEALKMETAPGMPESIPESEVQTQARRLEAVPKTLEDAEEGGRETYIPTEIMPVDIQEPAITQKIAYLQPTLLAVEILLVMVAVGAGAAAILMSRKRR